LSHWTLTDAVVACQRRSRKVTRTGRSRSPELGGSVAFCAVLEEFARGLGDHRCRARGILHAGLGGHVVSGTLRFATLQAGEDAAGTPMQTSLPNGNTVVGNTVYTPVLDRTIGAGHSEVAVIADMQYMSCYPTACPHSSTTSSARFTLFANQMNGDTVCASAPAAQTSVTVSRQTHHKVVPLYTTIPLAPGCDRIYAYVRTEYVDGPTGAIQGQANNLTDVTGSSGTGLPEHNSAMTHLFAVPS
jgi:hypothetical protein